MSFRLLLPLLFILLFIPVSLCLALQPEEILLIANRNVADGVALANYYRQQRQVPTENLLLVDLPDREDFSRAEYLQEMLAPLRAYLAAQKEPKIRCLLLFYGLPLRIAPPELKHEQWKKLEEIKFRKKQLDWQVNEKPEAAESADLRRESERLAQQMALIKGQQQGAALDSEIALGLVEDYPLPMWLPNPYFVGYRNPSEPLRIDKEQVLFVARLDAPTPKIVRRMIDDSLAAEQEGLQGNAYFDARWPLPKTSGLQGYGLYDASLHKAAQLTERLSKLPVTVDQQERLFQPGEAPQAALYGGWYSLTKYVDAFSWQPGSVGYHIASGECTTLKKTGSQVWCKRMLEEGVAATIGPVAEPYVQGFPLPELFFGFLLDGYYTLAESYFLSLPFLSWQMVLIGDPLYRPFRNH